MYDEQRREREVRPESRRVNKKRKDLDIPLAFWLSGDSLKISGVLCILWSCYGRPIGRRRVREESSRNCFDTSEANLSPSCFASTKQGWCPVNIYRNISRYLDRSMQEGRVKDATIAIRASKAAIDLSSTSQTRPSQYGRSRILSGFVYVAEASKCVLGNAPMQVRLRLCFPIAYGTPSCT